MFQQTWIGGLLCAGLLGLSSIRAEDEVLVFRPTVLDRS